MTLADLPLFSRPATRPGLRIPKNHRASFERFHAQNPAVYAEIVRRARLLKAAGESRWSTKAAFEVIRYETRLRTLRLEGEPKLNNSHTSHYARLIVQREPDLAEFFELRGEDDEADHAP